MKWGDFGLAVQLGSVSSKASTTCGTPSYMAPEVYKSQTCLKSDVWSLGISIIEIAEGKNPFENCNPFEVMNIVCNGDPPSFSSSTWSTDLVEFVKRCLVRDVKERASVEELMKVGVSSMSEE